LATHKVTLRTKTIDSDHDEPSHRRKPYTHGIGLSKKYQKVGPEQMTTPRVGGRSSLTTEVGNRRGVLKGVSLGELTCYYLHEIKGSRQIRQPGKHRKEKKLHGGPTGVCIVVCSNIARRRDSKGTVSDEAKKTVTVGAHPVSRHPNWEAATTSIPRREVEKIMHKTTRKIDLRWTEKRAGR